MSTGRIVRRLLTSSPFILATIFLFSALTPEPWYIQGYLDDAIPVFVESEADCAACSSFIVIIAYDPPVQLLPLVEQVHHFPSLITFTNLLYRGPPLSGT
jgi:hypothetical protein